MITIHSSRNDFHRLIQGYKLIACSILHIYNLTNDKYFEADATFARVLLSRASTPCKPYHTEVGASNAHCHRLTFCRLARYKNALTQRVGYCVTATNLTSIQFIIIKGILVFFCTVLFKRISYSDYLP